jgi:DME family drug/metabolite transporter
MLFPSTSQAPARRRSGTGLPYLTMSGVLWGTGGLLGTLLRRTTDLGPTAVATYRLLIGGGLLVAVILLTGQPLPRTRSAWIRITALSLLSAVYQVCYFQAVALTSVSLATLVTIGMSPVLVLAGERLLRRHRGDRGMLGVICLAIAGLGLLVGLPAGQRTSGAALASAGLALLSAAGFAAVTLLGARPVPGLESRVAVGLSFTAGGLVLVPFATATTGLAFTPDVPAVALLAALGVGPTAVAYTLYFRGLRTASASTAAMLALLEPLTGALLAAVVLGDRLGPAGTAGAGLLAAAVVIAARRAR